MYTYEQGDKLYKELEQINKDLRAGDIDVKIAAELNNNCGKRIQVARNQIVWYQLTNRIGVRSLQDEAEPHRNSRTVKK